MSGGLGFIYGVRRFRTVAPYVVVHTAGGGQVHLEAGQELPPTATIAHLHRLLAEGMIVELEAENA